MIGFSSSYETLPGELDEVFLYEKVIQKFHIIDRYFIYFFLYVYINL